MTTYILRHGQTDYSKRYLVNGDPTKQILLTDEGRQSLGRAWNVLPLRSVATWLTSEFPRARQTASLLMGVPSPELVVDARLNELDYGGFEGKPFLEYAAWLDEHGPRRRPPGAAESQHEGIRRLLTGVLAALGSTQGPASWSGTACWFPSSTGMEIARPASPCRCSSPRLPISSRSPSATTIFPFWSQSS